MPDLIVQQRQQWEASAGRHLALARRNMRMESETVRKRDKVAKVMHEWHAGELKSSSGHKVRSRRQAIAIALSEAGLSRKRARRRRQSN